MKSSFSERRASSGAIMLLVMVFLLLLALLARTSMQTGILEFRMTGNELFKEEAVQLVRGMVGAIADNSQNFSTDGPVGHTLCNTGAPAGICDGDHFVVEDFSPGHIPTGVEVSYRVERMGPALVDSIPFRVPQHRVSSSLAFDIAIFEIRAEVEGEHVGLGRAQLVQGIAQMNVNVTGDGAE